LNVPKVSEDLIERERDGVTYCWGSRTEAARAQDTKKCVEQSTHSNKNL